MATNQEQNDKAITLHVRVAEARLIEKVMEIHKPFLYQYKWICCASCKCAHGDYLLYPCTTLRELLKEDEADE